MQKVLKNPPLRSNDVLGLKRPSDLRRYEKDYSESRFWNKLKKYATTAGRGVTTHALELYYALTADSTPLRVKATIIGALGYFILPVDLIPDIAPLLGFTDDLAALMTAYKAAAKHITPEVKQRAEVKLSEWFEPSTE